jgi:uncharacterized membrane protein (UPF0127 family)
VTRLPGILLLLLACGSPPRPADVSPARNPKPVTALLTVRGHSIGAEVVSQPVERSIGLMFRTEMARDSGMLFVFEAEDTYRFWMKNTYLPLSIAYVDRQGIITDVIEMAPLDTTTRYAPSRAALYALEMNAGWFTAKGIKPGDTVRGIPAGK